MRVKADMARRTTAMQREFIRHMASTGNQEYAAWKAGYKSPAKMASKLMAIDKIERMTREEQQRFCRDDAGAIALNILVDVGTDPKQPGGARVTAGKELGRLAGIGVDEGGNDKDPGEMTGDDLRQALASIDRKRDALARALADAARPVIDAQPGVFD